MDLEHFLPRVLVWPLLFLRELEYKELLLVNLSCRLTWMYSFIFIKPDLKHINLIVEIQFD